MGNKDYIILYVMRNKDNMIWEIKIILYYML